MPWASFESELNKRTKDAQVSDLAVVSALARKFHVSLASVALRLITGKRATWSLWNKIPKQSNNKPKGGAAPDEPRTTPIIRLSEFGDGTARIFFRGIDRDLIDRSQVASHLRVGDDALAEMQRRITSSEPL
jgi:hypothetical protein